MRLTKKILADTVNRMLTEQNLSEYATATAADINRTFARMDDVEAGAALMNIYCRHKTDGTATPINILTFQLLHRMEHILNNGGHLHFYRGQFEWELEALEANQEAKK